MLDNTKFLEIKNRGFTPFDPHKCVKCNCNGGSQKRKFIFRYSYSARLCVSCILAFGSGSACVDWLEKNVVFNTQGRIAGFQQDVKK